AGFLGAEVGREEREPQNHGEGQRRGAGQDRYVGVRGGAGDVGDVVRQRDRQWLQARVLRDQERPQELVPGSDERDQGDRGDGGLHQRNRDREEEPQLGGDIDPGGFEQQLGQRQEELPKDEHGGGVDQERQDHAQVGVAEPVYPGDLHVERDHQQLERDRLNTEHDREQHAAASPLQARQRVPRGQPERQRAGEHTDGEDQGVQQ